MKISVLTFLVKKCTMTSAVYIFGEYLKLNLVYAGVLVVES